MGRGHARAAQMMNGAGPDLIPAILQVDDDGRTSAIVIISARPKFVVANLGFSPPNGKKMVQLQQFTLSRHLNESLNLRTF